MITADQNIDKTSIVLLFLWQSRGLANGGSTQFLKVTTFEMSSKPRKTS